ncbi:MAG: hypothetical protein J7647_31150 [Cyanobacteria bacterium SBLK]|nr:hypothetical protein [Cyanobacteria bacterium SBLK]
MSDRVLSATNEELCSECQEAEKQSKLDISCVLKELASARKNKISLSPKDRRYLCLCLCGYDIKIIAYRLARSKMPENIKEIENAEYHRKANILKADMSKRVHFWVKQRMDILDGSYKPRWPEVIDFFKKLCCNREATKQNLNLKENKTENNNFNRFMFLIEGDRSPEEINRVLKEAGINVKIKRLVNIQEENEEQ